MQREKLGQQTRSRVIHIPGCHFQTTTLFLGQNETANSTKNIITVLNKIEKNVKFWNLFILDALKLQMKLPQDM